MRSTSIGVALAALGALLLLPAASGADRAVPAPSFTPTRHLSPERASRFPIVGARPNALRALRRAAPRASGRSVAAPARSAVAIGETRNWLALDTEIGFYRKTFTLRGLGDHIEVWVASELNVPAPARGNPVGQSSGLAFLDGDCRNDARVQITDDQIARFVNEFESNVLPKESAAFSVARPRSGVRNFLREVFGAEAALYNPLGEPENTIVLVDNIRDENFYDRNNQNRRGSIGGFFTFLLTEVFDRNILSIDGYDWLHRLGPNPPNEPIPGDLCRSATARPYEYEATIAHEYQHLLEYYEDPDETNWVNEGLSDWAQTLTGYATPQVPITDVGFDGHIQCMLGWLTVQTPANPNPRPRGGPENSLTAWVDQSDEEILCDYGATYSMMELLAGRYGVGFMSALHRADGDGLAGLQSTLRASGRRTTAASVVRDWALALALDAQADRGAPLRGVPRASVTVPTLDAQINWDNPDAYSTPGVPPNGSDYIRLRSSGRTFLNGRGVRSLAFNGATTHPSKPIQWRVDRNAPDRDGNPALYSRSADERDEAIVHRVKVPAGNPTLRFQARWNLEELYDFAFVQVSANRGLTYRSVRCTGMTTATAPDAIDVIKRNVPGFNGVSPGWRSSTCSLRRYAGKTVYLSFRTVNDPLVEGNQRGTTPPGFWVDNIRLGGRVLSTGSTLRGWRSPTQVRRLRVTRLTVRLVSITSSTNAVTVRTLRLDKQHDATRRRNLSALVDPGADFVAAIVTYDEPLESIRDYAHYRLRVNGVVQPGGSR